MRLQNKLLVPLMALTIIPLLICGGVAAYYLVDTTRKQLLNEVHTVSSTTAEVIQTHFRHAQADLGLMANSRLLKRYLQSGDERYALQQPALIRQIQEYQKASPLYFEIRLILNDGFEDVRVVSRDLDNRSFDESGTDLFKALQNLEEEEILTRISPHDDSGETVAYFARAMMVRDLSQPFDQQEGKVKGYFVIALDMQFLATLLNKVKIGKSGYLLITDAEGNVLFKPSNVQTLPLATQLAATTQSTQKNGHATNQVYAGYLLQNNPVNDQLNIVAVLPDDDLQEAIYGLTYYFAIIIMTVMLVVLLLIYQHVRKLFLEPIYQLRDTVNKIGEGNLEAELPDKLANDEFGDLHHSIHKMQSNLTSSQEKVRQLAYFDDLTGLPNRFTLKRELESSISRAKRESQSFAVVFIDLDNFKDINDSLGHDMGDQMLIQVAERIQKNIRCDDYVSRIKEGTTEIFEERQNNLIARLGGDEFTLLLNHIDGPAGVSTVVKRLMRSLSKPVTLGDHVTTCGASMGIAIYPQDGSNAHEILKNADMAMYEAKKAGKNHFEFYSREMNTLVLQRLALESNLRQALDHNEFRLLYQPRVRVDDERIDGFEALIRWESPQLGFVSPNEFIPFAEESTLICEIGYWVLNTACIQIAKWVDAGYTDICVSVNLSPVQIFKGDTLHMIRTAMLVNGVKGENLEVEITESGLLQDEKTAIEFLLGVRKLGVRIALDDFGTGYSSLSYLRKLPIDILKIDRSFVVDSVSEDTASILESIIEMAGKLSLKTVAEGVETEQHVTLLRKYACDFIQGYYYAKPLPEEAATTYLTEHYVADEGEAAADKANVLSHNA